MDARTENEPFHLLNAWLEAQVDLNELEKQALFENMARCLQYDQMMPFYALCVVLRDQRVMRCRELMCDIAIQALRRGERERRALTDIMEKVGVEYEPLPFIAEASLTPEEIRQARGKDGLLRGIGVIAGLPWLLFLGRQSVLVGETRERVECFLRPYFPRDSRADEENDGVLVKYELRLGRLPGHEVVREGRAYLAQGLCTRVGSTDAFRKGWDEVFAAGSPYLAPDGHLRVQCKLTFV